MKKGFKFALTLMIAVLFLFFGFRSQRPAVVSGSNAKIVVPSANLDMNLATIKAVNQDLNQRSNLQQNNISLSGSQPLSHAPKVMTRPLVNPEILDPKGFVAFARQALKSLPRKKEMETLTDEQVHDTPATLIEKSRSLGEIAEALDANPGLIKEAVAFYRKCANDTEILLQIRARSLARYRNLAPKIGETVNLSRYPKDLIDLSDFIP